MGSLISKANCQFALLWLVAHASSHRIRVKKRRGVKQTIEKVLQKPWEKLSVAVVSFDRLPYNSPRRIAHRPSDAPLRAG
jgi:hypothetical protein